MQLLHPPSLHTLRERRLVLDDGKDMCDAETDELGFVACCEEVGEVEMGDDFGGGATDGGGGGGG